MTSQNNNQNTNSTAVKKVILEHPSGNEFVRAALQGMETAGILHSFYTSVACFSGTALDKIANIPAFSEFKKRSYASNLQHKTKTQPFWELGRIGAAKVGLTSLIRNETGVFCMDAVYHVLDRKVAAFMKKSSLESLGGIYAYEEGAWYSFKVAKERGVKCLYDLPIGYWRYAQKLLAEEREIRPEWAGTIIGLLDSDRKHARKDEELRMADHIFVASSFTAESLKEYPGKLAPISVIPYAFPPVNKERTYNNNHNEPLKLLFVGGLSQRKGIANVFEAVKQLKRHVKLTVVGQKAVEDCAALNKALSEHKWIPSLPHAEILKLMRQNDILLFPSLFEGFGLVITESMSQGTPVITTDRTAGPDLIKHGENGWLIEAGSTTALQESLEKILEQRSNIESVGRAAMKTAEKRSWTEYGNEMAQAMRRVIAQ